MTKNHPTPTQIFKQLQKGYQKKEHPFRFFSFATFGADYPALRTVVLRNSEENGWIEFYTDKRSSKTFQVKLNDRSTALFYHPKKKWQLLLKGETELIEDRKRVKQLWKSMPSFAKKDYSSEMPPGSVAHSSESIQWGEARAENFQVLRLHIDQIESLQLTKEAHQRCRYTKSEEGWRKEILVP